jgi:glycerophosphoryl diester phosphodiesterase
VIWRDDGRPLVIGHRGAPVLAPENTHASFEAAIEAGADAVELDVVPGLVVAHSAYEVPRDAISLDDALELLAAANVGVLVDVKSPEIDQDVVAAVRRHKLVERALVSSPSSRVLRRVATLEPKLACSISYPNDRYRISRLAWPRAVTAGSAAAARGAMPARVPLLLATAGARTLTLHHALVSRAVVRAAHARGARLLAWTVNDPARMAALAGVGVDGIVTDDPGSAFRLLATMNRP